MKQNIHKENMINEKEVYGAVSIGKLIDYYPDDEPCPSCLIYGKTYENRPLHMVCIYASDFDMALIITVYQPAPEKWPEAFIYR